MNQALKSPVPRTLWLATLTSLCSDPLTPPTLALTPSYLFSACHSILGHLPGFTNLSQDLAPPPPRITNVPSVPGPMLCDVRDPAQALCSRSHQGEVEMEL
jgi:hypothetical protein